MNLFRNTKSLRRSGFALVATISILSLLVLIALALMSLATVDTKNAAPIRHHEIARSNARMALVEAIGALQVSMGPDKKISANATIYDQYPLDPSRSTFRGEEIKHKFWVASLDSSDELYRTGEQIHNEKRGLEDVDLKFDRWLVSGTFAEQKMAAFRDSGESDVMLVGPGSLGEGTALNDDRCVRVPLVSVTNRNSEGKYGWWIGDNSQKATARQHPTENANTIASQSDLLTSGSSCDPSVMLSWLDMGEAADLDYLDKSFSFESLELHPKAPALNEADSSSHYFHDITTLNHGLLVNNANGRLKQDLSRLFAGETLPESFATENRQVDSLVTPISTEPRLTLYESLRGNISPADRSFESVIPVKGCTGWGMTPTWERLHDFHKLVRLVEESGSRRVNYNESTWDRIHSLQCSPPLPVVTRLQWFISAGVGLDNRLAYIVEPVITFWNPYNVELNFDESVATFALRTWWPAMSIRGFQNGQKMNRALFFNEKHKDHTLKLRNSFSPLYSPNTQMSFVFKGMTLKPGETMVYSDSSDQPSDWNHLWRLSGDGANYFGGILNAAPGWKNSGGHKGDGRGFGSIRGWDNYNGTVEPNTTIDIEVKPTLPYNDWSRRPGGTNWMNAGEGQWGWSKGKSMFNQLDLYYKEFHRDIGHNPDPRAFYSLQTFMIYDQTSDDLATIWGLNVAGGQDRILRTGIPSNALLAGEKVPICMIDTTLRTENDGDRDNVPYLHTSQVKGDIIDNNNSSSQKANSYWTSELKLLTSWASNTVEVEPNTNRGFFGPGNTAGTGYNFYSARDIPVREPLSLAMYRNFNLLFSGYTHDAAWIMSAQRDSDVYGCHTQSWFSQFPGSQKIVGNSFAHPTIPRDRHLFTYNDPNLVEGVDPDKYSHYLDHSLIVNHSLFNNFFHSGLSEDLSSESHDSWGSLEAVLSGIEKPRVSHLSPRLSQPVESVVDEISDFENGYNRTAKFFVLDGCFNVNSTSVSAWEAVLRGLRNRDVSYSGVDGDINNDSNVSFTPFPKLTVPNNSGSDTTKRKSQSQWNGFLKLSDNQIKQLAIHIVEQVKKRGPFHNLAEFVNRSPMSKDWSENIQKEMDESLRTDLALSGALQAAIDASGINDTFFADKNTENDIASAAYVFPEAAMLSRGTGATTFLTQGDLLQAIGNKLTTRGDTFTVRAYGDSRDDEGNVVVSVYLEAQVQRCVEYVDATDTPETPFDELTSTINKQFGRKMKLVSFKWLLPSEI